MGPAIPVFVQRMKPGLAKGFWNRAVEAVWGDRRDRAFLDAVRKLDGAPIPKIRTAADLPRLTPAEQYDLRGILGNIGKNPAKRVAKHEWGKKK